ncbi:PAS domain-containing sensor histidine kinase [Halomicrobium urmianum]|uniref:PAS domain-containing sensor histidine kinase n=1 Tax=Halomicrobium urmianum TaxID=1586233 RepID=UPI001CDA30F9|nr:PAS domain-containing sensor histidine kinase [Halomicrobium urmianum]
MTDDTNERGGNDESTAGNGGGTATAVGDALRPDGGQDPAFVRDLVAGAGAGVAAYDEDGRFAYVNDAYAALLGHDPADLIGAPLTEVEPDVEDDFADHWEAIAAGDERRRETTYRRADGSEVPVEAVTSAVETGGDLYAVTTVVDVAERVERRERLERQNERMETFTSVVSHDLRNPLNVAVGRTELTRSDGVEHLDAVDRSLRKMEALIDGVVTLVRQGEAVTDPESLALSVAVESAWTNVVGEGADLTTDDDLGVVRAESERLTTLFEYLFENAIVHAGPDVAVRVGRLDDGFYVADDGPGVPEDDREDVFEYGYTTDTDATGFGLAIVEEVATAHSWTVDLTEGSDGGARVEVHGVEFE